MQYIHRILVAIGVVLSLGLSSIADAANYTAATNAYERGEYRTALREFSSLSRKNDPYAQYMVGRMYARGEGTPRDYLLAYKWLTLAAEKGSVPAGRLKEKVGRKLSPEEERWARQLIADHLQRDAAGARVTVYTDKNTVRRVQRQLSILGYYRGAVDGVLGKQTRRAIRHYQQAMHLQVDGNITLPLAESLYTAVNRPGGVKAPHAHTWKDASCELGELRDRLQRLIRQGRKRHAAQPWFFRELEEVVHAASEGQWATR